MDLYVISSVPEAAAPAIFPMAVVKSVPVNVSPPREVEIENGSVLALVPERAK